MNFQIQFDDIKLLNLCTYLLHTYRAKFYFVPGSQYFQKQQSSGNGQQFPETSGRLTRSLIFSFLIRFFIHKKGYRN